MATGSLVAVSPMEEWTHNFYNVTQRFKLLRSWTNDGKVMKSHFTIYIDARQVDSLYKTEIRL